MLKEIATTIDYELLSKAFNELNVMKLLNTKTPQVAVQCRKETPKNLQLSEGCGSLIYNWDNYNPQTDTELQKRETTLKEEDFNIICDYFKGSYIEQVVNEINSKYEVFRTRFMMIRYKTCLSTHTDSSIRIHIPIVTNPHCYMVIDDKIWRLSTNKTYIVNTLLDHTAINAGRTDRVHLVFCTNKEY